MRPDYFAIFEGRSPPDLPPMGRGRTFAWQVAATATLVLGVWYLHWRWTASINPDAVVFSVLVAAAETAMLLGTALFFHDIWREGDTPRRPPPAERGEMGLGPGGPIRVDILVTTYDEAPEIVAPSLSAAAALRCPPGVEVTVHLLDDGARYAMAHLAARHGATYHARHDNRGFKAGNLKAALLASDGDLVAICDADTRLMPTFLENTLGYFRDPCVAWVQTPHWFYDIPSGTARRHPLARALARATGAPPRGHDPFMGGDLYFFDVIQRRRNRNGAAFCCGAASSHRRAPLFAAALETHRRARGG
ncbi:MAG: glycosyltransferase, partial [Shimia sp.]